MSDDLVYRLRDAYTPSRSGVLPSRMLYVYAADEIERLRAINAELLAALESLSRPDGFPYAWDEEEKYARMNFAKRAIAKAKGETQ